MNRRLINPRLAQLLVRLYPRVWRERYGAEFQEFLRTEPGDLRTLVNVVGSALGEHASPTGGKDTNRDTPSQFQSWCVRAPWAMFGLGPVFLLGVTYLVACLILWSGWEIFLPRTSTPFVPVDGPAIFYFGVGRLLYYSAPILVGWATVVVAARQRMKTLWVMAGLLSIAFLGGTAEVHAIRSVPQDIARVGMGLALGSSVQVLFHPLIILSLTILPWLLWRLHKAQSVSA